MNVSMQGVLLSLVASLLFALMPSYFRALAPLDGAQVFAQRVFWSVPAVLLLVLLMRQWHTLASAFARLRREPLLLAALPLASLLIGVQWGLFVWAPLSGHLLDVTLGYFLLPLTMVLVGRLFYGERLRPLQWLAVACALLGVLHELWLTGAFSWVTLLVAVGYPPYYMLRRWMRLEALNGFLLEVLLMVPLAVWLVRDSGVLTLFAEAPRFYWMLPGLGLFSALAFGTLMAASRRLPLGLFGILSYVEPALLFAVSVGLLGEPFASTQLWTYVPIWLALGLIVWDGLYLLRKQQRRMSG
ncbi:chemotaxis protein [Pseudomonas sp. PIC25]|uniref:EamA family transporter RarD n=1 Tax=Pseudomonas sp. PIC25 TaxID=1958773 RepID=UPI000BAB3CF9|nr:EamA family transporter RarD [Pseudomonas sp. PIC25]PAU64122.1 chemotaxis protein [Pseudomonas sp. PIC25]